MVKYATYAHPNEWLLYIKNERGEKNSSILEAAIHLHDHKEADTLEKGLGIAEILFTMNLDNESLAAAILYPIIQTKKIHSDYVAEHFGESMKRLLDDSLQMQSLGKLQHIEERSHQVENLRKLLLSMVTDVRAVLIVLAERLWLLRKAKPLPESEQKSLAKETMAVFSPLANRLGIWHLKWEMEDLCLRYLEPDIYIKIAKWLATRRQEREEFIQRMISILTDKLKSLHLKDLKITGRVKHIYSIYKKMQRKNTTIDQIYDISALRVLVPDVAACYNVLSLLQNEWSQVPQEFDDYISQPKANGYRSIHVVILGPMNRYIEIQIRTHEMHQESELGVAAHWRYKENVLQTSSYETKIILLREIMAWQKEVVAEGNPKHPEQSTVDLLSDRVYVFTPLGDIMDLPQGATPLDFAYQIHSEIGHRCRGAKINGNIVPLTYQLQTGERVEIITAKEPNPSRDWINPHLGYIKTSRARAKAQHWFRLKDSIVERETPKEIPSKNIAPSPIPSMVSRKQKKEKPSDIQILGVNNLLTNMAGCCKPLPGDAIVGYITQHRGVTIHRRDCNNINYAEQNHIERLIEVNWGEQGRGSYPVDLQLIVHDRAGLVRDITTMLASEKINLLGLQTTRTGVTIAEAIIYMTLEISNISDLNKAINLLKKIPSIIEVRRK